MKMEHKLFVILFMLCVCLVLFVVSGQGHPFHKTNVLFGTKTAYKDARNIPWPKYLRKQSDTETEQIRLHNKRHMYMSKCKATQLNMVLRHGTRFPGKKDIRSFEALEKNVNAMIKQTTGISAKVKIKFPWKNPFKMLDEKQLAPAGDKELYDIGRRFAARFPAIIAKPFAAEHFKFVSTCKSRCSESAAAFAMGYLKGKGHLTRLRLQPVPLETRECDGDLLLRFYDNCPKYKQDVEDNNNTFAEMNKFVKGKEVLSVVQKIKDQLGLSKSHFIDYRFVLAMYKACAFSVAIRGETTRSGWCSLFDDSAFMTMEYILDLIAYYEKGPFYPITSKISCRLVKDVIKSLNSSEDVGIFRFAHSSTLFPLYTEMGFVSKATPLRADNFRAMGARVFRSGAIAPFAGNIAFVKYHCKNSTSYVRAFINEKKAPIQCCKDPYFCTIHEFQSCYDHIVKSCDVPKMCKA